MSGETTKQSNKETEQPPNRNEEIFFQSEKSEKQLSLQQIADRYRDDSVDFETIDGGYLVDGEQYRPVDGEVVRAPLPEYFVNKLRNNYVFELTYDVEDGHQSEVVSYPTSVSDRTILLETDLTFRPVTDRAELSFDEELFLHAGNLDDFSVHLADIHNLRPVGFKDLSWGYTTDVLSAIEQCLEMRPTAVPWKNLEYIFESASERPSNRYKNALSLATALLERSVMDERLEPEMLLSEIMEILRENCGDGDTLIAQGEDRYIDNALEEIETFSESYPSLMKLHVNKLLYMLREGVLTYYMKAGSCLGAIANARPTAIIDYVPELVTLIEEAEGKKKAHAVRTLQILSHEYPEELRPAIGPLADVIRNGEGSAVSNAVIAFGQIAQFYPAAVEQILEAIVELFNSDHDSARTNAVAVVGEVASNNPDAVTQYTEQFARMAASDEVEDVRHNAVLALNRIANLDHERLQDQSDALTEVLTASSPQVRKNVCIIVVNAGVPVDTDILRELAQDDPDEDVRQWARRALHTLL